MFYKKQQKRSFKKTPKIKLVRFVSVSLCLSVYFFVTVHEFWEIVIICRVSGDYIACGAGVGY